MKSPALPPEFLMATVRPIAGLALEHGIHIQDILEAAKRALVEEAERLLVKQGERVNTSRLSVITGLRRREIVRLQQPTNDSGHRQGLLTKVIGQWQYDRRFSSRPGTPRVLSISDNIRGFPALVRSLSQDVHPGTVLFELERIKAVQRKGNQLRLATRVYAPRKDASQAARLLTADTSDLFSAIKTNIADRSEIPHLHARTEYTAIRKSAEPRVRRWLYREGSRFHARARRFLSAFDIDITPSREKQSSLIRVALGSYSFIAPSTAESAAIQPTAPRTQRVTRTKRRLRTGKQTSRRRYQGNER